MKRGTEGQRGRGTGDIIIPDGLVVSEPIRLSGQKESSNEVRITVGAGAQATIIDTMFCQGCERADSETNIVIDIAEGASLDFCSVRKCAAGGRTVSAVEAILASASIMRLTDCRLGGGEISSSVYAELAGEGAEFDMKSLFFGSGEDRLDLDYRVGHFASRATSRIITKGVLGDGCRARYLARTDIAPGLEGSSGNERIDALMLSRNARLDCSPELAIDSNDVRCSHGMSVSGLDESRLFYLMSRGIDRVGAMQAAAKGFMSPVLESLADSTLKKSADGLLSARLRCALTDKSID